MMPFLPASGGIPQPTITQCAAFSLTTSSSGGADGAAGGEGVSDNVNDSGKCYTDIHTT